MNNVPDFNRTPQDSNPYKPGPIPVWPPPYPPPSYQYPPPPPYPPVTSISRASDVPLPSAVAGKHAAEEAGKAEKFSENGYQDIGLIHAMLAIAGELRAIRYALEQKS